MKKKIDIRGKWKMNLRKLVCSFFETRDDYIMKDDIFTPLRHEK